MFTPMEWNQVEGALMDQLDRLAKNERSMTPGTFEAACVADAIRYTGSALTKVQVSRYGVDDPDDWGKLSDLLPKDDTLSPGQLSALWHEYSDR